MQRSRTRYAPPRSLAAPAGPAQATPACLQPQRADGIAQQVEKETGGGCIDEVDEAKGRDGQFDIKLDQDFKPLGTIHGALRPRGQLRVGPAIDYVT
jgi:hypothetical protein